MVSSRSWQRPGAAAKYRSRGLACKVLEKTGRVLYWSTTTSIIANVISLVFSRRYKGKRQGAFKLVAQTCSEMVFKKWSPQCVKVAETVCPRI